MWMLSYLIIDNNYVSKSYPLFLSANNADKVRLQSEVSRLKTRLSESDTKSEMVQTRLKELQEEMTSIRRKHENSLQTNKNLKQQVCVVQGPPFIYLWLCLVTLIITLLRNKVVRFVCRQFYWLIMSMFVEIVAGVRGQGSKG